MTDLAAARITEWRQLADVAIRDGENWNDRRLPEIGRALHAALDALEAANKERDEAAKCLYAAALLADGYGKTKTAQRFRDAGAALGSVAEPPAPAHPDKEPE